MTLAEQLASAVWLAEVGLEQGLLGGALPFPHLRNFYHHISAVLSGPRSIDWHLWTNVISLGEKVGAGLKARMAVISEVQQTSPSTGVKGQVRINRGVWMSIGGLLRSQYSLEI